MKIKRVIATTMAALAFAGMGVLANNTNSVSANQPWRASYKFNNRDLRCYYDYTDDSGKDHFQMGWLPRKFRNRNRVYRLTDPLIDGTLSKKRGYSHEIGYIKTVRSHHRRKSYYYEIFPNSRDLYRVKDPKKYIKTDMFLLTSAGTVNKFGNIVPKNERKVAHEMAGPKSYARQLRELHREDRDEVIAYNYDKYGTARRPSSYRARAYRHYRRHNSYRRRGRRPIRRRQTKRSRKAVKRATVRKRRSVRKPQASPVNATHKYLVGSDGYSGQIIDNSEFSDFAKGGGYSASSGNDGDLVHIINTANVAGKTFYQIQDSDGDDGWVYSGDLSDNPNGKGNPLDIDKFDDYVSDLTDKQETENTSNNVNGNASQYSKDEINLINQDRAAHGKAPLTESSELDQIAQMGAERLANGATFGHKDTSTGLWYADEDAYKLGYISSPNEDDFGENADAGDNTPEDANNALYTKEEPYDGGHYQNIISEYPDEQYNYVGVGVAANPNSEYGTYWVEDFK